MTRPSGQLGVVLDQHAAQVPDLHREHHEVIERIHGWVHVWEWPRGRFSPVCACGFLHLGPDDCGFLSRDEAEEADCPRRVGVGV
jgi:hypothetical protein